MDNRKREILFRYDPPVLIISLTWQETRSEFAEHLRQRLRFNYFGDEENVSSLSSELIIRRLALTFRLSYSIWTLFSTALPQAASGRVYGTARWVLKRLLNS